MAGWNLRARPLRTSALALAATACALASARAQEAYWLDPITVLATKTEELAINALAAVSTVREEQLTLLQPNRVSDIFFTVPGVWFNQDIGSDPAASSINIRGMQDFGRVAVIIDGARQDFQRSSHNANGTFYLDPELLAGADIVRGPVANIYGSGAIGGVVSFRTKDVDDVLKPGEKAGLLMHGLYGGNVNRWLGSLFLAARPSENFEFIAGGSIRGSDDYRDGNGNLVPNTGVDTKSALFKLTARPAEGHEVKLGAIFYRADYDSGVPNTAGIYGNAVDSRTLTARYKFNRPDAPLFDFEGTVYNNRTSATQTVKTEYAFNIFTGIQCFTPGTFPPNSCASLTGPVGTGRNFTVDTNGFDLHNTSRFETMGLRHALTLGGDFFQDDVTKTSTGDPGSPLTPAGQRIVYGAFAQWKTNYSTWFEVVGALRYDAFRLSETNKGDRVSPKITVGVTPFAGFTPYVTYAEGYRAPAVTEAFIDGYHPGNIFYFLPNPNLRPEVGKTIEAGLNLKYDDILAKGDRFRGKLNVFQNEVTDFIDLNTFVDFVPPLACPPASIFGFAGALCAQYVNIANAKLTGAEIEGTYDAGGWFMTLAYTHVHGINVDTGARLVTVPPDRVAAIVGARFFDRKLTAAVRVSHIWGAAHNPSVCADSTDINTCAPADPYTLVGLTLAYQPNENTTASLVVENLFNKFYVPYLQDQPSPGLVIKGSLSIKFGSDPAPGIRAADRAMPVAQADLDDPKRQSPFSRTTR